MSLIEQLGGYKKAKEIVFDPLHPQMTHVSNDGRHWVNEEFAYIPEINEQMQGMIKISDIRHSLLEHRREHKIYEAGDLVVMADADDYSTIFKVIGKPQRLYHLQGNDDLFYGRLDFQIRHATDSEIEAGKRLEGNS